MSSAPARLEKPVARGIQEKLTAALTPRELDIVDESARHASHSPQAVAGESHFRLRIVAEGFAGLNRVARHRLVNEILAAELQGPVHALALQLLTPDEAQN